MSSLLKYSLTWFSSAKAVFRLFQPFSTVSKTWDSWRPVLLWDGDSVQYFGLFLCHQVPVLLNNRLTFSWAFLLPHMHLQKPFLLSLISFTRFSYIWALLFMGAQTMSPYSSQVILHPLYASFLCWSWSRSYSFVHAGLLTIFEIVVMDLFWSWRR